MTSGPGEEREEEADPTGVRALLSSLPDPGPMPQDLVDRISRSLQVEQERRQSGAAAAVPLDHSRRARRPARALAMLGAAAAVAAVAFLAFGQVFDVDPGPGVSAQLPSGGREESGVEDGSAGAGSDARDVEGGSLAEREADGGPGGEPMGGLADREADAPSASGPSVTLRADTARLTAATLADDVLDWLDTPPGDAETGLPAAAAARCAAALEGQPGADTRLTASAASVDGSAAVLLVRTHPLPRRAWVLHEGCLSGSAEVLHGPVDLR